MLMQDFIEQMSTVSKKYHIFLKVLDIIGLLTFVFALELKINYEDYPT
jgi:hypothetical protein